jgi:hypothetical protein
MHIRRAVLLACVLTSACGGSNPAAPTPRVPNVVGNYSGEMANRS